MVQRKLLRSHGGISRKTCKSNLTKNKMDFECTDIIGFHNYIWDSYIENDVELISSKYLSGLTSMEIIGKQSVVN